MPVKKGFGALRKCEREDEMDGQILEGKRILVVDDEPDVLETVKEILASSQVVTVGSFDEARATHCRRIL